MLYIRLLLALASTIIARLARNYASILYIYEFQYDVARRSAGYSLRKITKNREWFARYSHECGLCAKFGFPECFLCKMFLCTTINFSLSNMRLAVNSTAIYCAIMASATENDHANTLEFKALEIELGYQQDDLLLNGQENSPKPAMNPVGRVLV